VLSAIMLSVVAPAESEVISPNVFVCCKNVKKTLSFLIDEFC
jgi:hypothetical protein